MAHPKRDPYEERQERHHKLAAAAWVEWQQELSPAERAALEKAKIGAPKLETRGYGYSSEADPATWSSCSSDPSESEPEPCPEHADALEAFSRGLSWVIDAENLVLTGERCVALLLCMRPSLARGLTLARGAEHHRHLALARELLVEISALDAQDAGELYGSVLEWLRRGSSLSAIGQRCLAMAYTMGLPATDGMTLQDIGDHMGKTRQAPSRLVGDARDTFDGLRSRLMRPEAHRLKCRTSQLNKRA